MRYYQLPDGLLVPLALKQAKKKHTVRHFIRTKKGKKCLKVCFHVVFIVACTLVGLLLFSTWLFVPLTVIGSVVSVLYDLINGIKEEI